MGDGEHKTDEFIIGLGSLYISPLEASHTVAKLTAGKVLFQLKQPWNYL